MGLIIFAGAIVMGTTIALLTESYSVDTKELKFNSKNGDLCSEIKDNIYTLMDKIDNPLISMNYKSFYSDQIVAWKVLFDLEGCR